jgi:serine phosphatase RsbU (regulator of sigma subunit)
LDHPLSTASVCRPATGEEACGDAFDIHHLEDGWLVLVADGLGHGPAAAEASQRAVAHTRKLLATDPSAGLRQILESCHRALAGTRGAALALCRLLPGAGKLRFSGVGNVALSIHPERRGLGISMPGVVGYRMRKTQVFESALEPGDLVLLYSDGISSRFSLKSLAALPLNQLVERLEADHGKSHDDATVVAVRVASNGGAT